MTNTLESLTLQILNNAYKASPQLMADFLQWEAFDRQIAILIFSAICTAFLVYARKFWKNVKRCEGYGSSGDEKLSSAMCGAFAALFMIAVLAETLALYKIKCYPDLYVVEKVISEIKR